MSLCWENVTLLFVSATGGVVEQHQRHSEGDMLLSMPVNFSFQTSWVGGVELKHVAASRFKDSVCILGNHPKRYKMCVVWVHITY